MILQTEHAAKARMVDKIKETLSK